MDEGEGVVGGGVGVYVREERIPTPTHHFQNIDRMDLKMGSIPWERNP